MGFLEFLSGVALNSLFGFLSNLVGFVGNTIAYLNNKNSDIDYGDLDHLRSSLLKIIEKQRQDSDFLSTTYVQQDVEVEFLTREKDINEVRLLTSIVKRNLDKNFLLLGEPGSGKSLSLIFLAKHLLENEKKLPIYINLNQWEFNEESTEDILTSLENYIKIQMTNRGDTAFRLIFEKNYSYLQRKGLIFFLFDSFDEIPGLFFEGHGSDIVTKYSDALDRFTYGKYSSKAVVASRYFKSPTGDYNKNITLKIKPFTEENFMKLMVLNKLPKSLIEIVFKNHHELVYHSKNALIASLVIHYLVNNEKIPKSRFDIYYQYFVVEIEKIRPHGTAEKIIENLAYAAYNTATYFSGKDLDAPSSTVLKLKNKDEILTSLESLKILRCNKDENSFYFSHKRFSEFLNAFYILKNRRKLDLDSLYDSSRYRDSLSLYSEICDLQDTNLLLGISLNAIYKTVPLSDIEDILVNISIGDDFIKSDVGRDFPDIANYINSTENLVARNEHQDFINNSFQFLDFEDVDSESDVLIVSEIKEKLLYYSFFLYVCLAYGNTLTRKLAVESSHIINKVDSEKDISNFIIMSIRSGSKFITEAALRSFSRVESINRLTQAIIAKEIQSMDRKYLRNNLKSLRYNLSLSPAYKTVRRVLAIKSVNYHATNYLVFITPVTAILSFLWIVIFYKNYDFSSYSIVDGDFLFVFISVLFLMIVALLVSIGVAISLKIFSNEINDTIIRVLFNDKSFGRTMLQMTKFTIKLAANGLLALLVLSVIAFIFTKGNYYVKVVFSLIISIYFLFPTFLGIRRKVLIVFDYVVSKINTLGSNYKFKDKEELYSFLSKIRSPSVQKKSLLELKRKGIMLSGNWPNNKTPAMLTQECDDLLAELDEKWLKL